MPAGGFPSSFVALVVEDAPALRTLIDARPERVRALHPQDLHVTLVFLGGIEPGRARAAFEAASAVPLNAMHARMGRMVALGPAARPSALSVLIEDASAIEAAIRTIRPPVAAASRVAEDTRPPLPHLTLARIHAKASPDERAEALRWASERRPEGVLRLERLALYTGRRTKEQGAPAYDLVAERALR